MERHLNGSLADFKDEFLNKIDEEGKMKSKQESIVNLLNCKNRQEKKFPPSSVRIQSVIDYQLLLG